MPVKAHPPHGPDWSCFSERSCESTIVRIQNSAVSWWLSCVITVTYIANWECRVSTKVLFRKRVGLGQSSSHRIAVREGSNLQKSCQIASNPFSNTGPDRCDGLIEQWRQQWLAVSLLSLIPEVNQLRAPMTRVAPLDLVSWAVDGFRNVWVIVRVS